MIFLEKSLRNELNRTVLAARKLAEDAAGKALHALGVDESDAPGHLDNDRRRLRIRLRAQARQLGDWEDLEKRGCYETRHLAEKTAYDHWHRLLFARFLAENNLLISPRHGVSVSLADCEELAPALGLPNGWDVAASFAAIMLPQIFRADDPAGNVVFAPEDRIALRKLVTELSRDIFLADDALGWVYQFWQAQRKEEVNKSGDKISADEIAPVTQLFTEDYMVLFLLHNTLGAWRAAKMLAAMSADALRKADEASLRQACALPGVNWEYLRFVKDEKTGEWRPAAGTFSGWPKTAKELRLLDPCMGSGHFITAELQLLVAIRIAEEGLPIDDAVEAVLRDNLYGLEIDPRCTQIAAFNLALAAWKLTGQCRKLPPLNLACCGLGINAREEDWLKLAGNDTRLRGGMERLFDLFQKAPELGSLIDPRRITGDLLVAEFHELQPLLEQALSAEETKRDGTLAEMGVTARGLAHAAEILAGQFTLIATNVPYLGSRKQSDVLKTYSVEHFANSKEDLATTFLARIDQWVPNGTRAVVAPQNWLYQVKYTKHRYDVLRKISLQFVARLGEGGFESPQAAGAFVALVIGNSQNPGAGHRFASIDAADPSGPLGKVQLLLDAIPETHSQADQLRNPDYRISFEGLSEHPLLNTYVNIAQGVKTGDDCRWTRSFWELAKVGTDWTFYQSSVTDVIPYGGRYLVLDWSTKGDGMVRPRTDSVVVGRWGVLSGTMRKLPVTIYSGERHDSSVVPFVPKDPSHLLALWTFCSSSEYHDEVRRIEKNISVTTDTLAKIPFELARWQKVAAGKHPHGLPKPHSEDPTQWLFSGNPKDSTVPLQIAVVRLLGYRWPRQTGSSFPDCTALSSDAIEAHADTDGIVCLSSIQGEQNATERLRALLVTSFGVAWNAARQAELLAHANYEGKTLEEWLRDGFFGQHCQLFHQRPFIWQIWDGMRDGFSALVNYHRLDQPTLGKLTYTYLGDWIARQKAAVIGGEEGSDNRLIAAQGLKAALEKILEGESPYDIFVRWKPLENQPIGWDPDLKDGVRLNIRPFVIAGILRRTPKINWDKDRGKDGPGASWFKVFKGDRINDYHLTLAEKRKARGI